jgi:hypothetical protein
LRSPSLIAVIIRVAMISRLGRPGVPKFFRFYAQEGEWWTALRGWVLMVVVFFAAGGFAVTYLNAGVDARAECSTAEIVLAQRRRDTVTKSRAAECAKHAGRFAGSSKPRSRPPSRREQARVDVKAEADPQAVALDNSYCPTACRTG